MNDRTEQLAKIYRREKEQSEETITIALCETYQRITGKKPSERLSEAIADAVQYHG